MVQQYAAPFITQAEAGVLKELQAAARTCRIAFGPRVEQRVLTVQGAMAMKTKFKQSLCVDIDGFSLPAAVRCGSELKITAAILAASSGLRDLWKPWCQRRPANGGSEGRSLAAASTPNKPQPPPQTVSGSTSVVLRLDLGAIGEGKRTLERPVLGAGTWAGASEAT